MNVRKNSSESERAVRPALALAVVASIALLVPTCIVYPFFHNRYVHPVGRLADQVEVGQPCDEVARRFADYVASTDSPGASIDEHELTNDLFFTKQVSPSRGLDLYDLSIFDDLQIRVRCDSQGLVAEKLVILD